MSQKVVPKKKSSVTVGDKVVDSGTINVVQTALLLYVQMPLGKVPKGLVIATLILSDDMFFCQKMRVGFVAFGTDCNLIF